MAALRRQKFLVFWLTVCSITKLSCDYILGLPVGDSFRCWSSRWRASRRWGWSAVCGRSCRTSSQSPQVPCAQRSDLRWIPSFFRRWWCPRRRPKRACPLSPSAVIRRFHDEAGSTSWLVQLTYINARCLLDDCSTFAWRLLDVPFTRSSKHRANVEQMYSNTRVNCSTSARRLLDVCSMFVRSCKRGIKWLRCNRNFLLQIGLYRINF